MNEIQRQSGELIEARRQVARLEALLISDFGAGPSDATATAGATAAARQAFEDVSAARALGEASADEVSQSRGVFEAATSAEAAAGARREQDSAGRAGIDRRLTAARAAVDAAVAGLASAEVAWAGGELQAADAAYVEHARGAAAAMLRVEALKHWLHHRGNAAPGPKPWQTELRAPALGTVSWQAATEANPVHRDSGQAWQCDVFPRVDSAAANMAIHLEVTALANALAAPGSEGGSLISGARRLVRRLAA